MEPSRSRRMVYESILRQWILVEVQTESITAWCSADPIQLTTLCRKQQRATVLRVQLSSNTLFYSGSRITLGTTLQSHHNLDLLPSHSLALLWEVEIVESNGFSNSPIPSHARSTSAPYLLYRPQTLVNARNRIFTNEKHEIMKIITRGIHIQLEAETVSWS